MYPRSFLCEEAKIKQRTSWQKRLCEISEEAIWESRSTSFFFIVTSNFSNATYLRSFHCEEAIIKQHTSLKKELCEIGEKAIWKPRFTCYYFNFFQLTVKKMRFTWHEHFLKNCVKNKLKKQSIDWSYKSIKMPRSADAPSKRQEAFFYFFIITIYLGDRTKSRACRYLCSTP